MDRRGFLGAIVGGVAVAAAVRTWPFRVYSFSTDIVSPVLCSIDMQMHSYTQYSGLVTWGARKYLWWDRNGRVHYDPATPELDRLYIKQLRETLAPE